MRFRNKMGELVDRGEAERMVKDVGIEVGYDNVAFDGHTVLIRSRRQAAIHDEPTPLFLTTVIGDGDRGMMEFPFGSETECRDFHRRLVERYQLVEQERQHGTHRVLLDGVL